MVATSMLDLGAGCGVIGIEMANLLRCEFLTLLELQDDFHPHLEINLKQQLKTSLESEIIKSSFGEWKPNRKYDLIVCNPPYYLPGRGQGNKDPRRELARSFVKDDWLTLMRLIESTLAPGGRGFLVIKNDPLILEEVKKNKGPLVVSTSIEEGLIFLEISSGIE